MYFFNIPKVLDSYLMKYIGAIAVLYLKVFPDGLMDDMASKNISSCSVSYAALQMKTDFFNQHCLSYKISNILQFNSSLFFWKLFETVLHWHNFFQDVLHIQNMFKYIKTDTFIFYGS